MSTSSSYSTFNLSRDTARREVCKSKKVDILAVKLSRLLSHGTIAKRREISFSARNLLFFILMATLFQFIFRYGSICRFKS